MEDKNESLKYIKKSFELKNQKLYKEAIETLYKVLGADIEMSTQIEVVSQLGDLHSILNNYDRAIEQYEHVLELDPNHEHSKNRLFDIYFEQKNYKRALSIAQENVKNSDKPLDYLKLFAVLLKLKRVSEIISKYDSLSDELKENSHLMYLVSMVDPKRRSELLEKTVEKSPNFTDAKFDLGLIYYEEGNIETAQKLFDEVLKCKKDTLSYYYKALILIEKKEFFPAIDNLHFAIKTCKGKIPDFYFELAKVYMDVNWFEEAISTIKKTLTLYAGDNYNQSTVDKCYLFLAWVFEKQKDYDNALFNLTLINADSELQVQAEILKALIEYKKGNLVLAKDMFENLYKSNADIRDDLTVLDTLGEIYKELKLFDNAKQFYKMHLKNFPNSIHTVCEFVDLLIDINDYDEAEKYMKKYSNAGKVASFLNSKARIAFRKKEYDMALSSLNELLVCDRNNAEGYYFKGLVLNTTGNYSEALSNIENALELNPMPAKYYAQAAQSHFKLGHYTEAMLFIKEAIEIEPNDLNYKKFAAEISKFFGHDSEAAFWHSIVDRTENVIKENKRF